MYRNILEMERCIAGVAGRQPPLCMALAMKPLNRTAAAVALPQFHGALCKHGGGCGALHVRVPKLRMTLSGGVLVKCESNHKNSEGRRSQRRSRSLNQATSSASQSRLAPVHTELELINDLYVGQGISDVLLELQKRDSPLQVLKVTIELCKKEHFVVPKAVAESDLKFWDEEDERLGKKVWFQLVSVEVDPGE